MSLQAIEEKRIEAKKLLNEGRYFQALEFVDEALNVSKESLSLKQLKARALIRLGAFDKAVSLLESLDTIAYPDPQLQEEILGNLASAYKNLWINTGNKEYAVKCRNAYLEAYKKTGRLWTGINSAAMYFITGKKKEALRLAKEIINICGKDLIAEEETRHDEELYWNFATMGEAHLLNRDFKESIKKYREAAEILHKGPLPEKRYEWILSSRRQLLLFENCGIDVPEELFETLKPPSVILFTGHMIDKPGKHPPRFPPVPKLEGAVRREIDRQLDSLDAKVGYSGAACGADLIFIEAMLDRGAEVNIFLPFNKFDYINTSVSHGGERWIERFNCALESAVSVCYVTDEKYLGDDILFAFAGEVFRGCAELRANLLSTEPYLLALWDDSSPAIMGGTASIVERWPDKKRKNVIDLQKLRGEINVPQTANKPALSIHEESATPAHDREIRTMLFADVSGYSKLQEEHVPYFLHDYFSEIAAKLDDRGIKPDNINTWGDALFAVMKSASPMAEYALALKDAASQVDLAKKGLPENLKMRIALHAGPVYTGKDPFTKLSNVYGSHFNRAARLEPVTLAGHVYASEQFAALLTAEQAGTSAWERKREGDFFSCEYVGKLELPKEFGEQRAYRITRAPVTHKRRKG